jgi:signal transduction histidine kinase
MVPRWNAPEGLRDDPRAAERLVSLGQLVSGVVHDLASSLGALRLRLQLLEADPELLLRYGKTLSGMEQIVEDGMTRVERLRDLVRARHARPLERVALTGVVSGAIDLVRSEVERGGREGRIRIDSEVPELPEVPGVAAELRHVLVNLLLNARDAMPDGGRIRVTAGMERGRVVVRVEDEGAGIPPEHLPRIFEPFFTTKGSQGLGLGLSMAKEVMERVGGSLSAENRSGGGARFTLSFPRAPARRGTVKPGKGSARSKRPGKQRRRAGKRPGP